MEPPHAVTIHRIITQNPLMLSLFTQIHEIQEYRCKFSCTWV